MPLYDMQGCLPTSQQDTAPSVHVNCPTRKSPGWTFSSVPMIKICLVHSPEGTCATFVSLRVHALPFEQPTSQNPCIFKYLETNDTNMKIPVFRDFTAFHRVNYWWYFKGCSPLIFHVEQPTNSRCKEVTACYIGTGDDDRERTEWLLSWGGVSGMKGQGVPSGMFVAEATVCRWR